MVHILVFAQSEFLAGGLGRGRERVGAQLVDVAHQKLDGGTNVHEDVVKATLGDSARGHQLGGVVLLPLGPAGATEVSAERLLPPRDLTRVAHGRERRHARVALRVAQRRDERAVSTHRVAGH